MPFHVSTPCGDRLRTCFCFCGRHSCRGDSPELVCFDLNSMMINFCVSLGDPNILDSAKRTDIGSNSFQPSDKNSCDCLWTLPRWYFSHCVREALLRVFCPTTIPPMGDRSGFAQKETLALQIEFQCFGLRLGGSIIHTCGHSFSGNRNNLGAPEKLMRVAPRITLCIHCCLSRCLPEHDCSF